MEDWSVHLWNESPVLGVTSFIDDIGSTVLQQLP